MPKISYFFHDNACVVGLFYESTEWVMFNVSGEWRVLSLETLSPNAAFVDRVAQAAR